jgi:hypothetical protein
MMNEAQWNERRDAAYCELAQPDPGTARIELVQQFRQSTAESEKRFGLDPFAEIRDGRLKLKRDDTVPHATDQYLQNTINASLHKVRIENLLIEVDRLTGFSRHFVQLQQHQPRPPDYYKTLLSAIISQATNLGVVSMSSSVTSVSIDITSLKDRTTPAHMVVQRLPNSYPADRLSKAVTNLGRIINGIHPSLSN